MKPLIALALALVAAPAAAETVEQVAVRYKLAGEVLVAKGSRVVLDRAYGTIAPAGGAPHRAGERWRLASVTKQVTAALLVGGLAANPEVTSPARDAFEQAVPATAPPGKSAALAAELDAVYLYPALLQKNLGALTLRQVLTHHSGLANPDDTPAAANGVPAAYKRVGADPSYCVSRPAVPGATFSYNNCDYILLGEVLRQASEPPGEIAWPAGLHMAGRGEKGVPGYLHGQPEPAFELSSWDAAGGLIGTARAVFGFDRRLMTGKLLPDFARAQLWTPEGHGSYQALGQWVFPGQLHGCAKPKRIVQRDGEIYGVQVRNYILPDDDIVIVLFTNRGSDDFPIGEVWQGKGFAYDLLSAAACPA